ncbi:uncharacterized protein TNCV_3569451 [Trichonephila clavipes]|nr:uncharacterized protein TNCV_3569451 [Trichonephila clavipes]
MPRVSTKVFKKRRGVFNKGRCNKSNDGCGESNFTVPKNSADEKNCADGAKLCTNETEPSASERKIVNMDISYSDEAFSGFRNVIVDINLLACVFFESVKCIKCEKTGLRLHLSESNCGEAVKFHLKCPSCKYNYTFFNSKKCDSSENYELNTRLVYAMRCIAKGAESARMFCGIMNLPPPPTKFSKYNQILLQATRETCEHSMAEAVREAVDENDGKRDLAVAVDGSWQKRGFSSKNGLVTVTSVDTGKVIDVEVFQNIVFVRTKPSIFKIRSQSLYNVRYTKYLGDGDSKAFTSIVENKVYGDHCSVEKLECIDHVMKRMGTRLRRLKTKMRGQKLSDGKPLCGRNRLTEAEIDRLQAYYGLAIRRNLSSVKDMQQAIWAIFLHKLSTDEKPQHGFCPSDSDTWCKFKKAELLGETYHHKNSLPVDVVEAMRPVFRDLTNPELLKKCLHGGTQNPNESVNNVIWSRVPKKTFVQLEVLSLGTYDAVSSFNMGNVSKLEILRKMCIEPGDYTVQAMECLDKQRLLRAKYYCLQKTKEVRKEKRLKRKKEDDELLKMLMI